MRRHSKAWSAVVAVCTAALVLAALVLPRSFQLTALSDWVQCLLLLSGTLSLIPNAVRSQGRLRVFWALLATGMGFWFSYQVMWTYFEVLLRKDVPDLFAADIILFLHIVPFMAALALRPHSQVNEYAAHLRRLDFALMMVWWMYLYILAVMAWQYVVPDVASYDSNLNLLYLVEKLAFLVALFVCWWNSRGGWKRLYANLFGASLIYASSSYFANWAIGRHVYYSGSLYDIPLVVSMAWITRVGLQAQVEESHAGAKASSPSHSLWLARLGMITVFSLPLFAAWALLESAIPLRVRSFRLILTLGAALIMGVIVFVRQRLLDRELMRLLLQSQESITNLKRLQTQLTESEKLASIGQLVGGAAHELNNPITAMMGYSDLLLNTPLNGHQQDLAERVGQHVRRTRGLVASLLSFAKPGPVTMAPVDLRAILQTAIRLSESGWQSLKVEVRTQLEPDLPPVMGDSNQLLQAFVQILNHAVSAAGQLGVRLVTVEAEHRNGFAIISILGSSARSSEMQPVATHTVEGAPTDLFAPGWGLKACQGILTQYQGKISWEQGESSGIAIHLELPVILLARERSAGPRIGWQPQSFA